MSSPIRFDVFRQLRQFPKDVRINQNMRLAISGAASPACICPHVWVICSFWHRSSTRHPCWGVLLHTIAPNGHPLGMIMLGICFGVAGQKRGWPASGMSYMISGLQNQVLRGASHRRCCITGAIQPWSPIVSFLGAGSSRKSWSSGAVGLPLLGAAIPQAHDIWGGICTEIWGSYASRVRSLAFGA